jgi:DNA invertase Pin-like site-specific DNA recombinase
VVESNPFPSTKCLLRSVAFLQKWRAHASVSLADFAKIVEQLGSQKVSFLSVTQPFNTTTSMGRMTLNVLLSVAQFEREVTGERIRAKRPRLTGGKTLLAVRSLEGKW